MFNGPVTRGINLEERRIWLCDLGYIKGNKNVEFDLEIIL